MLSHPDETVAFLQQAIMAGSVEALKLILGLHSQHWRGLEQAIIPLLDQLNEREQRKLDRVPQIANYRKLKWWKLE